MGAGLVAGALAFAVAPATAVDGSPTPSPSSGPGGGDADRLTWGIQPSSATGPTDRARFELTLDPGEEFVDYVGVSNYSERAIDLVLYATDAFNTADGGFALLGRGEAATGVGSWIRLQETDVTIPARTRLDIPFLLSVPDNATPGDHIGGIVAALESPADDGAGGEVLVERRIGTRVYLRVDGPLEPSLALESFTGDYEGSWHPFEGILHLEYLIRNDGNVTISGSQLLTVTGPFGIPLKQLALTPLPELLPGAAIPVTFDLPQVPPAVILTTDLVVEPVLLSDPGADIGDPTAATHTTLALPWMAAGIAVLVIEAGFAAWWLVRRNRAQLARVAAEAHAAGVAAGRASSSEGETPAP